MFLPLHDAQIPTQFTMSFKILVSITKTEKSDMESVDSRGCLDIFVSVVTAIAGELLLRFVGCAPSLADDLIF